MNPKPLRTERLQSKYESRQKKAAQRRASQRERVAAWDEVRREVGERDGWRCRACGAAAEFKSRSALKNGHAHHIVYRSAQGSDALDNLVWLCAFCHDKEHTHRIMIVGTADRITVSRIDIRTGDVVATWEG